MRSTGKKKIRSRVVFHDSTLGIATVHQMGVASLDREAFRVQLNPTGAGPGLDLGVAFNRLREVKALGKESDGETSYMIEVQYEDSSTNIQSITLELRVFFARSRALKVARAWKDVFHTLQEDGAGKTPPAE